MSVDSDLDALGALTAATSNDPAPDGAAQDKVAQAVAGSDVDSINTVLVDFSLLQAEAERAEGLHVAAEGLRQSGRICQLTAEHLSTLCSSIFGAEGRKVAYTQSPTRVGLSYAIESLLTEEAAARSQFTIAAGELIVRAGKQAQHRLSEVKAASRKALAELALAMADFNDEFYSVALQDVCLNNGDVNMDEIMRDKISITDPFWGEQSMAAGCKEPLSRLMISADMRSVPRWINNGDAYAALEGILFDVRKCVEERAFVDQSSYYPEDQARLRLQDVIQAAGSTNQTAYEAHMEAGITEAIFQLNQFLPKEPVEGEAVQPVEDGKIAAVISLTKKAAAMARAYEASVCTTLTATALYRGLTNNPITKIHATA